MKDYKQKYKEALGRAIAKMDTYNHLGDISAVKSICEIFPELKESEDERIRQHLLGAMKSLSKENLFFSEVSKDKVIAWLEKQGEQKSTWSDEDENMFSNADESLLILSRGKDKWVKEQINSERNWLKSLKERVGNFDNGYKVGFSAAKYNQWKPSDEQLDALHDAAVYVEKSMFPYPKGILMKLYEQLKKLKEE